MVPAAPPGADNSMERHRELRANCFLSHTLGDTTNTILTGQSQTSHF